MLADLISMIRLTDTVVLDPIEESFVEWLRGHPSRFTCHRLARQPAKPSPRTPAELRAMHCMAYFHQVGETNAKWSAKPISTSRPSVLSYDGSAANVFSILSYGQSPHPDFLAEMLDGSVVAIVTLDERHLDDALGTDSYAVNHHGKSVAPAVEELVYRTPDRLPYVRTNTYGTSHPLHPKYSECVGLALVRAVDTNSKRLQLVTSLSEDQLGGLTNKKVVLVRGGFDAADWAYLEDLHLDSAAADDLGDERPWVSRKEPVGIEGAVWRLRHPPMANAVATK